MATATLTKEPWQMTKEEWDKLPTAYRGIRKGSAQKGWIFVTPERDTAKYHAYGEGAQILQGKILNPDRLIDDPEVSGFEGRHLTGPESFEKGSARVTSNNFIITPHGDLVAKAVKQGKPVPPEVLKDYPELGKKRYAELKLNRRGTAVDNPEDVADFPPVKGLSNSDLLELVKTPAHNASPKVKEYFKQVEEEFAKRDGKLKPTLSAKPSEKPPKAKVSGKTETYYINQVASTGGGGMGQKATEPTYEFKPVKGRKVVVPGYEDYDFFAHGESGSWKISDAKTGAAVTFLTDTIHDAASQAKENIDKGGGKEAFERQQAKFAKETGVSPRYKADKPVPEAKAVPESKKEETVKPINDTWRLNRQQARNRLTSTNMDLHRRAIKEALELGLKPYKGWQKDYPELIKRKPPAKPVTAPKAKGGITQAVSDWLTGKAYIDNQGNYHVKTEGSSSGPIASWNKEAKQKFKTPSELHQYATKGRARVGIPIIDKTQAMRSARAIAIDNSLLAKQVVTVNDPRWLKRPNRFDVRGIDTPGSKRILPGVAYADRKAKRLSRRHHRGWKRVRFA